MKDILGGLRGKFGTLWKYQARPAIRPHHHDELEFNLVMRGTVRYLVDDRRHDLRRHDLLWLFPAHEHLLVQSSPDAEMWIGVLTQSVLHRVCTPAVANAMTAARLEGPCLRSLPPQRSRWLDALCEDLGRRCSGPDQPDPDGFSTGLIHAFVLAWEAFRAPGETAGAGGADVHPAVEQAARLIAGGDDRSFSALAKAVGMTRTSLSRRFQRDLGLSLVEHRNRCRVERFLDLRRGGRRSVLDAALAAGFGSYPQFHRVFRRMMGSSPRQHLRAAQ